MWKHFCLLCRKGFDKKNAWFLHANTVHAYKTMEGEATTGTTCWCCAKQYPTTGALKNHLRYSKACCTYFWQNHDRIANQAEAKQARHPQLPWVRVGSTDLSLPDPINRDQAMLRQELEQVLRDFAPPEEDTQFVVALAEALTEAACRVMPIEEILETLKHVADEYSHPNQREIHEALHATAHCISNSRQREEADTHAEEVLNSEEKRKKISIVPIRACIYRLHSEVYVLHFFSGRRRAGDLQQALEGLTPPDATMLFVISLDVMVSVEHGNLTDEHQQQAILRLIRQGAIAAGYAGPPCETWTVARFEKVATRRHAPRPLRLKDQPWGLLHVSLREGQQLDIGNELMCFAIHALFEIAVMGNFGAKSAKPTTFFIAGLSHETTAGTVKESGTFSVDVSWLKAMHEYCGTVLGCMFTIFRCILGDCTTKGGRSLTLMWSHGYGVQFDVFYAFSMVCVIFGMFNIITAIFVEATMNGLKDSETERKYAQAYESNYMTEQLGKIVLSITKHVQNLRKAETVQDRLKRSLSWGSNSSTDSMDKEMFLTEEEFISAIRATDVRMLLDDLDVVLEPRPGVFEAFNSEEDGTVSMSELVSGLMSFRGELHKVGVSLGIPKTIPRATPAAPRQKLLIFGKQPRRESVLFEYHRHPWVALVEMLMLIQDVGGTRTNPVLHMLLDKRRGERRGMVDVAALSPLWHIARETMVVRPRPEDGDVSCKEMESCCACLSRLISVLGALLVVFLALFGMACVVIDGVVRVQKDLPLYELGAHTIVQRVKAFVKSLSLTFPEAFLTMVSEKLLDEAKLMLSTALGGLLEYLSNVIFELLMLGLYVLFWLCTPMPIASTTETIFRRYLFLKGTACLGYGVCVGLVFYLLKLQLPVVFGTSAGLTSFVLSFIPEVGAFLAMLLSVPVILCGSLDRARFDSRHEAALVTFLSALAAQLGLKFFFTNIVEVKLVENDSTMKMHPVVTLLDAWLWSRSPGCGSNMVESTRDRR
ncbi:unnamed protein product [Durusdinium trenchii]|uniref:C2H2-type domain-containing protein n=1 Tax=Durusdinium trenchii TaxID=1381693 RepID=A0ABP0IUT9_9DINO